MGKYENSEIEELRRRLEQLERMAVPGPKRRGWTNQKGAADYLGCSEEWLRQQINAGGGPKHQRRGPRIKAFNYDDLDAYQREDSTAA